MIKSILVIDDETDVREMIAAILSTKGHDIHLAEGGEEGLRLMKENSPDLVICDLMMPRMSGLEVIKRKKRDEAIAAIPMIILSALPNDSARPDEFWKNSLGVEDYLAKPFDPLDLLGRVEYILRRSGYVSARNTSDRSSGDATISPVDLEDATPAEVVRAFVESWNIQDFATEFGALGEEMLGNLTRHDYVERRRRCYIDEKGHDHSQLVAAVDEEKVSVNVAKVVITRLDRFPSRDERRKETYTLRKGASGWKIIACRIQK